MEENSGIKFQQAMVALARQWVGQDDVAPAENVTIVLPDESLGVTAQIDGQKNPLKTETYPLPHSVDDARMLIERFQHGADALRSDEDVSDNVVQHMLADRTSLLEEKWLGTEEEEKNAYVSELLYIHSKVMIVDDRRVIVSVYTTSMRRWLIIAPQMGSANINDRSQKVCVTSSSNHQILTVWLRATATPKSRLSSRTRT